MSSTDKPLPPSGSSGSAPPSYSQSTPPAGYRIPLSTDYLEKVYTTKEGLESLGPVPAFDLADKPTFVASCILPDCVHPAKFAPHLGELPARYSFAGKEISHKGRFDILPMTQDMEWVQTSRGLVPNGRTPVEAGYEKDGRHLHHALAQVPGGTMVLGKTAPHLNGCNVPFGGQEVRVSDYAILCWKTS